MVASAKSEERFAALRRRRIFALLDIRSIAAGLLTLSLTGMSQPAPAQDHPSCPGNPDALGTTRVIAVDPATPPVGLKTYPRSIGLADHEVVLTFDDGPSPVTTPRVLAALEHECVRATFFLIGRNAAGAGALVRREIADGDTVGHHTWSHPAVTERGLPDPAARADIDHGFAADDMAAYHSAAGAPRVPFFRFPGFADSPALLAWLKERRIVVFGADLWASDWVPQTPEAELALLMQRLDKAGRGIVLLHDIKPQTAAMLPAFLGALKAGHYHVVALVPGAGPTPLREAPEGWTSDTEKTLAEQAQHRAHHAALRSSAPPAPSAKDPLRGPVPDTEPPPPAP